MVTQQAQRDTDVQPRAATAPAAGDLARLADELLHQVTALRKRYEELSTSLAEAASDEPEPVRPKRPKSAAQGADPHESLHVVALQMAFAGHTREQTKAELRELGGPSTAAVVDEVYDRTEAGRAEPKRRRWFVRRRR